MLFLQCYVCACLKSNQKARMILCCTKSPSLHIWVRLFSKRRLTEATCPWTCLYGCIPSLGALSFFQQQIGVFSEIEMVSLYACSCARFKSTPYNHMLVCSKKSKDSLMLRCSKIQPLIPDGCQNKMIRFACLCPALEPT
jgi:hypothetical protein